jgi:hypothetical protein
MKTTIGYPWELGEGEHIGDIYISKLQLAQEGEDYKNLREE